MATTTNFGWVTPDNTALVKDGASAIRTLGSSIDTTMAELKGGTSGQILSKTTGTDMDFTWIAPPSGGYTLIASKVFSNDASGNNFTSIPQTYKHLMLTGEGLKVNLSAPNRWFALQWNGVTSATYSSSNMMIDGTSYTSSQSEANNYGWTGNFLARSGDTAGYRNGRFIVHFPDYTDTADQKQAQFTGASYAGGAAQYATGNITNSATTAISSIYMYNANGENLLTGTFRLWGI